MDANAALEFVRTHGVVLVSATGAAPRLVEAIAGEPVTGSWWAHPKSHAIFATLQAVVASDDVLVCRLVDGKTTLVHRRLWPALVRLSARYPRERLAQVHEQHTASGRHETTETPFPRWVPDDVKAQAMALGDEEATTMLGNWQSTVRVMRRAPRGRQR